MAKRRNLGPWQLAATELTPPVSAPKRTAIAAKIGVVLTQRDWALIESTRAGYVEVFRQKAAGVEYDAVRRHLEKIVKGSRGLRDLLFSDGSAATVARVALDRNEAGVGAIAALEILNANAEAILAQVRKSERGGYGMKRWTPWNVLVADLAEIFERKGIAPTAANSLRGGENAKPSPFVKFVLAVRETLPMKEHSQSDRAAATAIQRALTKTAPYRGKTIIEGGGSLSA